jgi:type I restriction enzyme S subunit
MAWETQTFGDVCKFVRGPFGGSLKKNIFKEEGYAVYEQKHAIYDQFTDIKYYVDEEKFDEMIRFELFSGDLIMSCSGTMGKVAIVPPNIPRGIINQALLKLTPNKSLSSEFLKLWMESRNFQEQIEQLSQGAAIKNMASVKILKEIKIPTPSESEQKRIVALLDTVFADLEQTRAKTEQNLKNARELFESKKLSLFESLSNSSNLSPLSLVCENIFAGGDAPQKDLYSKEETEKFNIPIYANAVRNNGLYGFTDYSRANEPSITIAARGSGTGHIELRTEPFLPIVRLIVLTPNKELISLGYFKHALQTLDILRSGSAIPQLTVPMIKEYSIPVPDLKVQGKIVLELEILAVYIERIEAIYQDKLTAIDELKKSILQKAFSGELTATAE